MIQRFRSLSTRFASHQRGAVAILFALSFIPMIGLIGVAVDYSGVNGMRSGLISMADSATVGAVSEQVVKPSVPADRQRDVSREALQRDFEAQLSQSRFKDMLTTVTYDAKQEGDGVEVTLCFSGRYKTMMLAMVGVGEFTVQSCSSARSAPPVYVSVHALIDASGSMGIGATHTDQKLMEQKLGCAFACHTINDVNDQACNGGGAIPRNWWSQTTKCTKAIGARTRFDVVRDALMQVTDQAQTLARVPNQYRLSVHKFSNYLTEVQRATTSMSAVKSALERMTPDQRGGGSNFYKVLADFAQTVPAGGDGKSPETPKVFVLILTDGIGSRVFEESRCYFGGAAPCRYEGSWRWDPDYVLESPYVDGSIRSQAFPARLCDSLKRKNATVMTLATEFDSSGINDGHMKNVDRVLRVRAMEGLAQCATATNLAYSANLGPDVDRAIRAMFSAVVEKARIVR